MHLPDSNIMEFPVEAEIYLPEKVGIRVELAERNETFGVAWCNAGITGNS